MKEQKIINYVLPNDFRLLSRRFIPVGVGILVLFSLFFLKVALINHKSLIPNLVSAIIFLLVSLFLIICNYHIIPIVNLSFSYSSNLITNQYGSIMNNVITDRPLFLSEVPLAFSAKGIWVEIFFILSNHPFIEGIDLEQNGIYVLNQLTRNQIVILPSREDTYKLITSRVGNIHIPSYPKVVYSKQSIS